VSRPDGLEPIERLRAADPTHAAEVPDASLARVSASVQEHIVTDIQHTSAASLGRRAPLAVLGGAALAGVFVLAVASAAGLGFQPPAEDPGTPAAGGGGMAMCLAYDPANLPMFDIVFDGTVTAVNGDQVTFAVNEGWKGVGDSVTLTAPDVDLALLGEMPDFEVGGRYLITAAESTINACNYSLDYEADEAADWAAAFAD
jgi:hypothetical protein